MNTKLLTLENIAKYYASGQTVVMGLNNINLSFSIGEFVAITGESGSGKSTLAKVLAGIHTYENGEMTLNGKPTSHYDQSDWERYRAGYISFISQSYDILPGCSVMKNVVSSLILTSMDRDLAKIKSEKILRQVELWDMRKRRAAKLSSGQKQRLSIARALAKPAPILIADEPTGNLDAENSAKVIELLAAAAKERLVIIITHDFSEVENFATRHITIREGAVDTDVVLRKNLARRIPKVTGNPSRATMEISVDTTVESSTGKTTRKSYKKENSKKEDFRDEKTNLSLYTARLQMSSRPVWTTIMLLFFWLTAFAMFAFLGTFVVNLDDRFTRIYDESAFYNGSDDLLFVMRTDKEVMNEEDWESLLDTNYVESLERYGYLSEVCYFYREGIDYHKEYRAEADPFGHVTGEVTESWSLGVPTLFMQTVPLYAEETEFLTAGRLPENMYEIVAQGDEAMIGKTMPVFLRYRGWAPNTYILMQAEVVGVTNQGSGLYFDERLADSLTCSMLGAEYCFGYDTDYDFTGGRFHYSKAMYEMILAKANKLLQKDEELTAAEKVYEIPYTFTNFGNPNLSVELLPGLLHDSTYRYYVEVEKEVFDTLVPTDNYSNIVSVKISDYAYADRVMDAINRKGYASISPYQLGSTEQDPELAAERMQTLKVCLLCFVAVFLLQVLVLRAMFGMEIEEFKLLANLGLRCNTAKLSVVWQILFFTICGQIAAFVAILICHSMQIERIVHIVKYLPFTYVLLFMLIHLTTGLLTSLWIQRSMGKQIYPFSLQRADLKLDEEEEV